MKTLIPVERIEKHIYVIRGHKVMLDKDLAALYQIPTRRLKEQVNRNPERFPSDFLLRLSIEESEAIVRSRSHFATMKRGGNIKYGFYAFTEQGVSMASSVLKTKRAILMNVEIMRAFVKMRGILESNKELARKLGELESKVNRNDKEIGRIFTVIYELMNPPAEKVEPKPVVPKRRIGFGNKNKVLSSGARSIR